MTTLYRQYRPDTFKEVIGQNHITETLKAAISQDRLAHAYLFHGPRGTGKTTTARLLAKRANCQNPNGPEPCGQCPSCQALANGSNIDVIEIDAASNRGIDDIRALRERIVTVPNFGQYKVYIIDEVHMLTQEASTALLKTLEEPVKHVIFVLATTELHKVLPTILSRCQVFRFRRASQEELAGRLKHLLEKEERQAEDEVINYIAERSDGCFRDAESLLGQLMTLQQKELKMDSLVSSLGLPPTELLTKFNRALYTGESAPALKAIEDASREGLDLEQFTKESIVRARDTALKFAAENKLGLPRWSQIIRALLQALQDLAYVPQPTIALHLAILTLCDKKGETENNTPTQTADTKTTDTTAQLAPKPKPAPAQPENKSQTIKQTEQQPTPPPTPPQNSPELQTIKSVWPTLIEKTKQKNPVASTFLRAVEPIDVGNDVLTIRARYSLHKNFFTTPKNKTLLAETLNELLQKQINVNFVLDEKRPAKTANANPDQTPANHKREDQFYSMVKEVFD